MPSKCSKCGATTYASTLFCQSCGAALSDTGNLNQPGPNDWYGAKQPAQVQATKKCPFCAETILAEARKCKHCGEMLDERLRAHQPQPMQTQPQGYYPPQPYYPPQVWNPGIAAVLSLFISGAGQMYKGKIGEGVGWLIFTVIGYVFLICPGIIIHLACIFSAAKGDPTRPGG